MHGSRNENAMNVVDKGLRKRRVLRIWVLAVGVLLWAVGFLSHYFGWIHWEHTTDVANVIVGVTMIIYHSLRTKRDGSAYSIFDPRRKSFW